MSEPLENKKAAVSYLLGELNESDSDAIEERLFTDEVFSIFVDDVETDLVDSYVRGELSFEEKRRFESKYLNSESRRQRVEIARTLQERVFAEEASVASADAEYSFGDRLADFFSIRNLAYAGASAIVLMLLFTAGFWILTPQDQGGMRVGVDNSNQETNSSPEVPPPGNQTQEPNSNQDENVDRDTDGNRDKNDPDPGPKNSDSSESNKTTPPARKSPTPKEPASKPPARTVFATTLLPPLRSSKRPVLAIPPETKTVRLGLGGDYGDRFEKYRVRITDSLANTVWSGEIAGSGRRSQQAITISLAADKLKPGAYEAAVRGVDKSGGEEDLTFYNFVVRRL